jgi:acetyl-CoA decarbonylase/synthase complex subunit gamma
MALTALDIYKKLPRTNCKKCGFPTCMALAMQVAAKQKALTDCPDLADDVMNELSDASSPPMKLVKIGNNDKQFELGQETVMFRHEEKFHHPTAIAVKISSSLSNEDVLKRVELINNSVFERVGEKLKIQFCAVEVDEVQNPTDRVRQVAEKSNLPLILMGKNAETMKTCVETIKSFRPLIFKADSTNIDSFLDIAKSANTPLAIEGQTPDQLAELTQKAKDKGVEELLLSFNSKHPGETLQMMTQARRAALLKNFKPLGYPCVVEIEAGSPELETVYASTFASKYAGIVIMNGLEPWQIFPILTSIQDIYTDPQVPNTVESKLYEIGNVNENSPVLFTTNFALTFFCVSGEVERSKIPTYISVVDTEGMGVLNAYAGDKISPEKIVKTLQTQQIEEKVNHNKLIIPGLLPVFRAEIQDTSYWKEVIIGPETAREIPVFLTQTWK